MGLTSFVRYTCDFDDSHVVETGGPMPADWLQLTVPPGDQGVFDTIECATSWYEQRAGA